MFDLTDFIGMSGWLTNCDAYTQGKVSANEMYHIGFRCRPSGTQDGATLLPAGEGESKNPWCASLQSDLVCIPSRD